MNISAIDSTISVRKIGRVGGSSFRYVPKDKPDTFESTNTSKTMTVPTRVGAYSPLSEKYSSTITTLESLQIKAQTAFDKQRQLDGWNGKFADKISVLWGSKKRSAVVSEDLKTSKAEIEHLSNAAKDGNFESEFFDIFGVNYDKEKIDNFEQASKKYTLIKSAQTMADFTEHSLRKYVDFFIDNADSVNPESPSFDRYKKHPPIAQTLSNYEAELAKFVGGKENLQKLATTKMNHFICASREEKIEVYGEIAEGLIYTSKATASKLKGDKKDSEIQKEYDNAYAEAYGTKNNIQKKVTDYVKAQQIRATAVKDLAISGIIGAAIATSGTSVPALLGSGITVGGYIGMDLAELATNQIDNSQDMTKDSVKDIVKCALLSGAEYFIGSKLYDVIPAARTGKKVLDTTLNLARTLSIEFSTAFVSEYAQTGKWATDQINPKAFIKLTLATFAAEELVRMGLSAPSGLKSDYSPQAKLLSEQTIQNISTRATKELEKQFADNPLKVMNLKLISIQNPELFQELLASSLQEVV